MTRQSWMLLRLGCLLFACCLLLPSAGWAQEAPSSGPLSRLLAPQADRALGDRQSVARDVEAWKGMPTEAFVRAVEQWFPVGEPAIRNVRSSSAMTIAAEKLFSGDGVAADPKLVARLYAIGSPRLQSAERVRVRERFLASKPWNSLSVADFLSLAEQKREGLGAVFLRQAMRAHAAELLQSTDVIENAEPAQLVELFQLGHAQIDNAQRGALRMRVLRLRKLAANASLEELQDWVAAASIGRRTFESESLRREVVAKWLDGQQVAELSLPQQAWLLTQLHPKFNFNVNQKVQVTWSGKLSVPRDGEYRLSTSPIDPNTSFGQDYRYQTITVRVDGREVIRAANQDDQTAADWQWRSEPVSLSAGRAVSIEFEMECDRSYDSHGLEPEAMAAMLHWEGPGMSRDIIPGSAFETAEGRKGLDVTYRWTDDAGQAQETRGVDRNVECVWGYACLLSHQHRLIREQLAASILRSCAATEALAKSDPTDAATHPVFGNASKRRAALMALESATCDVRRQWIENMSRNPAHFDSVHFRYVRSCFPVARMGVEDEALDLLLAWAERFADAPPVINDVGTFDRLWLRDFAVQLLASEHEGAIARLEADGLEDEAGNCNLAVAYLCAGGCVAEGRIMEWIQKLDAVLNDKSISGDKRVNWLIARAMAQEIRGGSVGRRGRKSESYAAGMGFLQEAMLTAESSAKKAQVLEEMLTRQVLLGQLDLASETLSREIRRVGEQGEEITEKWEGIVAANRQIIEQRKAEHVRIRRQAFLGELQRRRAAAQRSGRSVAASSYSERIKVIESAAPPQ